MRCVTTHSNLGSEGAREWWDLVSELSAVGQLSLFTDSQCMMDGWTHSQSPPMLSMSLGPKSCLIEAGKQLHAVTRSVLSCEGRLPLARYATPSRNARCATMEKRLKDTWSTKIQKCLFALKAKSIWPTNLFWQLLTWKRKHFTTILIQHVTLFMMEGLKVSLAVWKEHTEEGMAGRGGGQ